MFDGGGEEVFDMVIRQGVKNALAFSVVCDDVMAPEGGQLMRDDGLADVQNRGDVIDTELVMQEQGDDAQTRRIGEQGEQAGDAVEGLGLQQGFPDSLNVFRTCFFVFHASILSNSR